MNVNFAQLLIKTPELPKAVSAVDLNLIPTRQTLLNDAASLAIDSAMALERGRDVLRRLSTCWNELDDSRKAAKDPFRLHAEAIDAAAKPLIQPVKAAMDSLKDKIGNYCSMVEGLRLNQERERLAAEATAAANQGDRLTPQIVVSTTPQIAAPDVATRSDFVIDSIDMTQLPRAYMLPNEAAIKADGLKGITIPGVVGHVAKKVIAR